MNSLPEWWLVFPSLAAVIPCIFAVAGCLAPARARTASVLALGAALLFCFGAVTLRSVFGADAEGFGVRSDAPTCVMLLLVATLGAIVVRYSGTYLAGDPGLPRYLRWLLLTLSAVTALVIANDLLIIALAWTATSLALHQLLTFYPERTPALIAAHKKFLVSRLADACLVACLILVHANVGSFGVERIVRWVEAHPSQSPSLQAAAVLLVLAVALRSAQLPFHGWLIQVMEAPTPVSALLHAGVVNIGGFVLIRLAPWIGRVELAQTLLVVIGLTSAVVGALVMTTRVSVKVALAWSTCAQMGFMLVQCGLGLWPLALLHLVAHSLYKAYAFLSAGSVVDAYRVRALQGPRTQPGFHGLWPALVGALGLAGLVTLAARYFAPSSSHELPRGVLALLVGLSVIPLLPARTADARKWALALLRSAGVVLLYFGWHAVAAELWPVAVSHEHVLGWTLAGAGCLGLFGVKALLEIAPEGRLARALQPWLFAGLYLDESFTRLTFRLFPPRLERRPEAARPIELARSLGAEV